MMSMTEQIARMRQRFPAFEVLFNGGWHVEWEGPLRPLAKTYVVRIGLVYPRDVPGLEITPTWGGRVSLVEPRLAIATDMAPGARTPHVYWNERNLKGSPLCIFDPVTEEWTPDMAIADTTVPWTIDWLGSYEGWLATGEWTGGGRHPAEVK